MGFLDDLGAALRGAVELVANPVGKISQMTGDFVGGDVGKGIRDIGSIAGGFTSPFGVASAARTGSRMAGEGIGGETGRGLMEAGKSVGTGLDVLNLGRGAMELGQRGIGALKNALTAPSTSFPKSTYGIGSVGLESNLPGPLEMPLASYPPSTYGLGSIHLDSSIAPTPSLASAPTPYDTVGDYAWKGLNTAADAYSNPLVQAGLKYADREDMKRASQDALNQQLTIQRQNNLAGLLTGQTQGGIPSMYSSEDPLGVYAKYAGMRTKPTYYTLPVNYPVMGG